MGRKGFTLIEIIIVVVIIGILIGMAVPQFFKAQERARQAKAKSMLLLIAKAENLRHNDPDLEDGIRYTYQPGFLGTIGQPCASSHCGNIGEYIDLSNITSDAHWAYWVILAGTDGFFAVARKMKNPCMNQMITLSHEGVWQVGGYDTCVDNL